VVGERRVDRRRIDVHLVVGVDPSPPRVTPWSAYPCGRHAARRAAHPDTKRSEYDAAMVPCVPRSSKVAPLEGNQP
jgi:hypothetical protein